MGATLNDLVRRFINASSYNIVVGINSEEQRDVVTDKLLYGDVSEPELIVREQKVSLFFLNADEYDTEKEKYGIIKRIDDIFLPFGHNYSIIFTGDAAIIQQEF